MKKPCPCLIDTCRGLALAGNDAGLYLLFLKQFLKDDTVFCLTHDLEDGQTDAAFLVAHSLKGLCAQLGLEALRQEAEAMCDILRGGQEDALFTAREQLAHLVDVHQNTVAEINALADSARE